MSWDDQSNAHTHLWPWAVPLANQRLGFLIKDCGINIAGKWRVPGDDFTGKRHTQQEVMMGGGVRALVVPPSAAPQWPDLGSWCFPDETLIWSRLSSKHCRSTVWEFLLVHCWFCFAVIQAQVVT